MIFLDTNVAIDLRDGEPAVRSRILTLQETPVLSMVTRIELENGACRGSPDDQARRRALLTRLLGTFDIEQLNEADVQAYGAIVAALGYDRQRTLDRLIAAQAIVRGALLITRDTTDFRNIPGLRLEIW